LFQSNCHYEYFTSQNSLTSATHEAALRTTVRLKFRAEFNYD